MPLSNRFSECGISVVELMVAAAVTLTVVLTAAVIGVAVERAASHELSDAAAAREGRFAVDEIARALSLAGSNPYDILWSDCAPDGEFAALTLDPDRDGIDDDVRIRADVNPANGLLSGTPPACDERGEDVMFVHDGVAGTLTRREMAGGSLPQSMTDSPVTSFQLAYFDAQANPVRAVASIARIEIELTVRSRARNPYHGRPRSFTYRAEVRVGPGR